MFLFVSLLLIERFSANPTPIEFDEYGNKYIRTTLASAGSLSFELSLRPNEYLFLQGSSSIEYELTHTATNTTFTSKTDDLSRTYFILTPDNTQSTCWASTSTRDCELILKATNAQSTNSPMWMRFNRNRVVEPSKTYADTIMMQKRRRYGMRIFESDLPLLVQMTPNQKYHEMDLDLYGYSERQFTSYFYPNSASRNHINNVIEEMLITASDSYFKDGEFFFFEVYGSTDSSFEAMDYTLSVTRNYAPHFLLKRVLLVMAFIIAGSFLSGVVLSFLCSFRHRIMFCLRIRSSPHRQGAAKRDIRKLEVITFSTARPHSIVADSPQCIICLDDYADEEKVRILRCHHHFHKHCSDEWFFLNKRCPLCLQNIADAEDVHVQPQAIIRDDEGEMDKCPAHIEMAEILQHHEEHLRMMGEVGSESASDAI